MDLNNTTDYLISMTTLRRNISFPAPPSVTNLVIALLSSISFILGITANGIYLWVLRFKMKKTVNTLLFFHLILSYLISALIVPFKVTSYLQGNHWSFGIAMCKIFNSTFSLGMFASVFILCAISLDRYVLTLHPVWSQQHRNNHWASITLIGIWIFAAVLSIPYLVFRETQKDTNGVVTCKNNYALFNSWKSQETQALRKGVHITLFISRLLLGFLLPLFTIIFCYGRVAQKMKQRGLVKSSKPFKVMVTFISSFFVCWMPYHVYQGLLINETHTLVIKLTLILTAITVSFNTFFSPTFYLFIGENFKKVFKQSIVALFESVLYEKSSLEQSQNLSTIKSV
ncbi:LOW QUALITY PROTEIN: probable G-protein coupled receptor 33 [Vombatus ursinus]|uniref:LOW QUALITY PROTEIN: probable G-protein coupled receptor 33 n=1 Tax=Vombatus ursinus TaxID=29139 RepID=UPI000FFD2CBD|nr:LOW QUALITY PROTEIN: probable G-protein coupled receptor 33 [Vombatus ursinus]